MATKKKELLEQDAPVTETVMSESETLLVDTAQPESLPADAGDGLDLNELLGLSCPSLKNRSSCNNCSPLGSISVLCAMISLSLIPLFYRSLQHLRSHRTGNRRAAAAVLDENDESIRRGLVAQEAGEPCVR